MISFPDDELEAHAGGLRSEAFCYEPLECSEHGTVESRLRRYVDDGSTQPG